MVIPPTHSIHVWKEAGAHNLVQSAPTTTTTLHSARGGALLSHCHTAQTREVRKPLPLFSRGHDVHPLELHSWNGAFLLC